MRSLIFLHRLVTNRSKSFFGAFVFFGTLVFSTNVGWGQSYLGLDGGFEGTASIDNTNTYSAGQANLWSKSSSYQTILNETSVVRSGNNSLQLNNSTTTGRRCYTPTFSPTAGQRLVIQFYRRVSNTTDTQLSCCEISRDGTIKSTTTQTIYNSPSIENAWEKVTSAPTSTDFVATVWADITHKQTGVGGSLYIDDVAVYTANGVDEIAPDAPTSFTITSPAKNSLDVSWSAPASGTDGGGYLVVRGTADPTTAPNVNGIYASGNTIASGMTVVYQGAGTGFTDSGLSTGTTYFYRVYTYDKAYNYSMALTGNGTTISNNPEISLSATSITGFTYLHGYGPSEEKNLSVSGFNLTSNLVLTAPADYEISLTSGSGYAFSLSLAPTDEAVKSTTVYIRLKSGLNAGNYAGENILVSSTGAADQTASCSGNVLPLYTWIGADKAAWTDASNWNPTRTTCAANDVLQFNDGTTKTITSVPTETIGQLFVKGNTLVTLQTDAANTLTISGSSDVEFSVEAGSQLNLSGTNALIISIASGCTGSVSGSMTFEGGAHQLLSNDAGSLTFNNGSLFTAGNSFNGYAFGNTNLNSVVFAAGSVYVFQSGSNPFGATAPKSVVVFQTGSLYKSKSGSPAFSGRTYADLEIDMTNSASPTGSSAVSIDNLTVTNGTLNFNVTGNPGHSIKGNITVASGATLNFSPSSTGTINLNGTATQTISGAGTITIGANSALIADNTNGVVVNSDLNLLGNLTVNPSKPLTISGKFTNNGTLNLLSDATGTATLLTTGTIEGAGKTIVNQYLPSVRNWYISSPVVSSAMPSDMNIIYSYNEADNTWPTISSALSVGTGYIVVPNIGISNISFSGTLINGDQSIHLTRSATNALKHGFNLVGNPYPSFLNVDNFASNMDLVPTFWYRSYNSGYVFDTYNIPGSISTGNSGLKVSGYIPPMQAFWVRMAEGKSSATLNLTNEMRAHQDDVNNKFRTPDSVKNLNQVLRLLVANNNYSDEAVIYFNPNAANGSDVYDSPKMSNNNPDIPEIYTVVDVDNLVINGMRQVTMNTEIPLYFVQGNQTSFTIKATEFSNFDASMRVILKDKLNENLETDITDGIAYSFNAIPDASTERFSLIFRTSSTNTAVQNPYATQFSVISMPNHQLKLLFNRSLSGEVVLYNAVGQQMIHQNLNGTSAVLRTSLPTGVYVLNLYSDGKSISRKVIIE
jgi:hypothetical protein